MDTFTYFAENLNISTKMDEINVIVQEDNLVFTLETFQLDTGGRILLESGDGILLETGDSLIKE